MKKIIGLWIAMWVLLGCAGAGGGVTRTYRVKVECNDNCPVTINLNLADLETLQETTSDGGDPTVSTDADVSGIPGVN